MVKFCSPLTNYGYILSFDLAKRISGYSLLDIRNHNVIAAGVIDTSKCKDDFIWSYFYNSVLDVISKCVKTINELDGCNLFITKEKLPNQNGKFSTIETLQGLAQAHAIFDLAVTHSGVDVYDYAGVHSVSVKAYFKLLTKLDKPQKEDIANYIKNKYNSFDFDMYPLDVTDSIAVALTLIYKKWDADLSEEIKAKKKALKNLKLKHRINEVVSEIELLEGLKTK